jgi:GTPase SAR1 family protein
LSYPGTDVFLLCYSVVDPQSLENLRFLLLFPSFERRGLRADAACARSRWLPEIRRHCPDVPFILVGCKRDLAPQDGDDVKKDEKQEGHGEEIAGGEQEPRARGDGGGVITQPQQQQHVSYEQAQLMAFELGAMAFIECSTKTAFNLDETIALAANYAVYQPLDLIADQGQRRCLLQ